MCTAPDVADMMYVTQWSSTRAPLALATAGHSRHMYILRKKANCRDAGPVVEAFRPSLGRPAQQFGALGVACVAVSLSLVLMRHAAACLTSNLVSVVVLSSEQLLTRT